MSISGRMDMYLPNLIFRSVTGINQKKSLIRQFFGIFDDFGKFLALQLFAVLHLEKSTLNAKNLAPNEEKPC